MRLQLAFITAMAVAVAASVLTEPGSLKKRTLCPKSCQFCTGGGSGGPCCPSGFSCQFYSVSDLRISAIEFDSSER